MDAAVPDEMSAFYEEVAKEIITEAPSDAWHQPQPDDLVILEFQGPAGLRCSRAWRVGSTGAPPLVAGLDLDRCVRTMRRGECSTMRSKKLASASPVQLQLHSVERSEDMFGDGCVTRTVLQGGSGWQTPQPGSEVLVRFGWHSLDEVANPENTPDGEHAPLGESLAAAASEEAASDGVATEILLSGSNESIATLLTSRALKDLQRLLLVRLGGAVVARATHVESNTENANIATLEGVVLKVVSASGKELVSNEEGMSPVAAQEALRWLVGPAPGAAGRKSREVVIKIEENGCRCDAEDWIPGKYGMRVLSDLRTGQRCLVHLSSDVSPSQQGKTTGKLEYDVELLKIMTLEDVSLDKQGRLVKKVMHEGNGYERPSEGAEVTLRVEACDDSSGANLLESRELTFSAACGRFCTAIDEIVLTMKKGQVCEVRCSDPAALVDDELQLHKANRKVVTLTLELLSFEKIDVNALEEPDKVAHCTRRKEAGTKFFQSGSWRRALRRYQHVTSLLAYVDHWKQEKCKTEAVQLRRACHLNAAACWLKLEVWPEADQSCKQVLREEPSNVKALFRRGQALNKLGEFREAGQIIRRVLELDPDNKEAQRTLVRLRQAAKAEAEEQKGMFSRMARGIVEDSSADTTGEAAGANGEAVQAAVARGDGGSQALVAEEEEDDSTPMWCWGLATVLLLGSTLGAVAYMKQWRR